MNFLKNTKDGSKGYIILSELAYGENNDEVIFMNETKNHIFKYLVNDLEEKIICEDIDNSCLLSNYGKYDDIYRNKV